MLHGHFFSEFSNRARFGPEFETLKPIVKQLIAGKIKKEEIDGLRIKELAKLPLFDQTIDSLVQRYNSIDLEIGRLQIQLQTRANDESLKAAQSLNENRTLDLAKKDSELQQIKLVDKQESKQSQPGQLKIQQVVPQNHELEIPLLQNKQSIVEDKNVSATGQIQ